MDGILSDTAIRAAIDAGDIEIDPFTEEQLNVTSYDLTLGDEVRVYSNWVMGTPQEFKDRQSGSVGSHPALAARLEADRAEYIQGSRLRPQAPHLTTLDLKAEPVTESWKFDDNGLVLKPGIGYLLHTKERVCSRMYNPVLDGKSSIGRLFIQVHATAGYGDVSFDGQYTLEVVVQHQVKVYPGMKICQVRFHTVCGTVGRTYDQIGHYVGASAKGAVPSQAWKQFK